MNLCSDNLSREEEIELAKRIEQGDKEAYDKLVCANLRIVITIAKSRKWKNLSMEDAIQEGNLGLMHAARKFDYRKGYRFITYAVHWIRQYIGRAEMMQTKTIYLPVHVVEALDCYRKTIRAMETKLKRCPTETEVAECMKSEYGWSDKKIRVIRQHSQEIVSLNTPVDSAKSDMTVGERMYDPNQDIEAIIEKKEFKRNFYDMLASLKDRERDIMERRYGLNGYEPQSLEAIGNIYGISRERVRQIESATLKKLRNNMIFREAFAE